MKNIIDLNQADLKHIKKLAVINDLPFTNQNLINLSLKITNEVLKSLEEKDFENLFNLKKIENVKEI